VRSFDEIRIGPGKQASPRFELPLPVPGSVVLPEGRTVRAQAAHGPAVSEGMQAVVAAPEGPLVVRTRLPGDRVRFRGREVSLRRFLMERRVSVEQRCRLPLVASGPRVLWVPGQPVDVGDGSRRFVRLKMMESARS
jgi:tRNA(Ile)-lysidine synthetase-like protein